MQSEINRIYGRNLTPAEAWFELQSLWSNEKRLTSDTGISDDRWREESLKSHRNIKFTSATSKDAFCSV